MYSRLWSSTLIMKTFYFSNNANYDSRQIIRSLNILNRVLLRYTTYISRFSSISALVLYTSLSNLVVERKKIYSIIMVTLCHYHMTWPSFLHLIGASCLCIYYVLVTSDLLYTTSRICLEKKYRKAMQFSSSHLQRQRKFWNCYITCNVIPITIW